MKDDVFPLQQGALDWLCSIYAAINVMHVRGKIANLDEAAVRFGNAIEFMQSAKGWNLSKALCEGIDEEDCCELFQKLSGADWDVYPDIDCPDRLSRLKQLLDDGAKAVIVSLVRDAKDDRDVLHYTVVMGVSSMCLTICDSQGKEIQRNGSNLQYDGANVSLGYFYVMKAK